MTDFDAFAEDYEWALSQGLRLSGESAEFFVQARIHRLSENLRREGIRPRRILDFGCGTGTTARYLQTAFAPDRIHGVDPSAAEIAIARRTGVSAKLAFSTLAEFEADASFDLVYCNGVFHHIPPDQRADAVRFLIRCLRPQGVLALWDNNPWNPGARWVMSRIPFDRDAVMLSAGAARRLLRDRGMDILRTQHWFIFPRVLRRFRGLEKSLCRLPLGAQYQVLARRPEGPGAPDDNATVVDPPAADKAPRSS